MHKQLELDSQAVREGRLSTMHWVVLIASLLLTFSAWYFSQSQIEARTQGRFDVARDRVVALIKDRMTRYEDALWSGVASISASDDAFSHHQWHEFARNLRIVEKYPGINGIGVIFHVDEGDIDRFVAQQRIERPDFATHPPHAQPDRLPITFIEPEAPNAAAVGLDVAFEQNRYVTALKARDRGTAQITGPIVLVQDSGKTPGFLFYAPFYRNDAAATLEERREGFVGLVYAPFVVHRLMDGLLSRGLRDVRLRISDEDTVIYDEDAQQDDMADPDPMFADRVAVELYGRTWSIDIWTSATFRAENSFAQPTMILVSGLTIDLLLLILFATFARRNKRAVEYADEVTRALRQETKKLTQANREIERFAYVASHDLKTPVRGIGWLTEMLSEDLEGYFALPDANPAVAENLEHVKERVSRMESLIQGILQYTEVGKFEDTGASVLISELATALESDFRIPPGRIKLTGGELSVGHSPNEFRRVMENLVGNAIKYHDRPEALEIGIEARRNGDALRITVSDNGPGIDPQFHGRIFRAFEKLGLGDAVESTGIGLSIVKKAVESHGGTITLTSQVGQGASFAFDWPSAREAALPGAADPLKSAA